jgi:hypothetical protein
MRLVWLVGAERFAEERDRLLDRRVGGVRFAQGVQHHEIVNDALVADGGDRDAYLAQLVRVRPSSRNTSAWPVITSAGGSPASSSRLARSGDAVISSRRASSGAY